ncbi:hypothetical protein [Burkholderia multivorans]|uniref:hypothetical protein n=1 Tax=Burkholderia multivorans TaxID=87883 RepID=UPI0037099B70
MADQQHNGAAVRVCSIADAECSRGCGTGACKREQPAAAPIPYDGLTEEFTDEVARLANDAPGIREAVSAALENCNAIIAPQGNAAPAPADERAAFEAKFPMPPDCIWTGNGYSQTRHDAWRAKAYANMWEGWKARAVASSEASLAPIAGERELFEKWAVDTYGPKGATRDERFPNSYLYSSPDDAWAGWQAAWQARAASANETGAEGAEPMAVPAGWKLVPVAPTFEMCRAMEEAIDAGWKDSIVWARGIAAAPQPPAQADAREGLTDEQRTMVRTALAAAKQFIANGVELGFIRMPDTDCPDPARSTPKLIDGALALLDAHPGRPEPRAEVTDEQIADMFERVTGYSIENGRAALNDADILGFARELLDAARAGEAS